MAVSTGQEVIAEEPKKEDEQKKRSLTPEKKVKVAKKIVKVRKQLLCLITVITLCASCSAVYCNQSCLWVGVWVWVGLLPR